MFRRARKDICLIDDFDAMIVPHRIGFTKAFSLQQPSDDWVCRNLARHAALRDTLEKLTLAATTIALKPAGPASALPVAPAAKPPLLQRQFSKLYPGAVP